MLLTNLLISNPFVIHEYSDLWKQKIVGLDIISNCLIALAYYAISLILFYVVYKRRHLPWQRIFLLFGAFTVACGTTHLIEVGTFWYPHSWFSGGIKFITASVSMFTAIALFTLLPQVLAFLSLDQVESTLPKLNRKISDYVGIKAALQQTETRFRLIFEKAGIGIVLSNIQGQFVAANPTFQEMLGYSEGELIGRHFTELTHPDYTATEKILYQKMVAERSEYYHLEKRYLTKAGKLIWGHLTVSLVRDSEGNPQFYLATIQNITERKQAESALRHYQENLEELVAARTAELTEVNERLSWQASHDALTGLANRLEFERCLEKAVTQAKTLQQEHTLCYMDLDRFKIVNDTCGHSAGDEVLRQISCLLQSQCRKSDTLARLGGDEFGLLLYQCAIDEAQRVVQTIHESMQKFRFVWEDQTFKIGLSIGVVAINPYSSKLEDVLSAADTACYIAKNRGRNQVHIYQMV